MDALPLIASSPALAPKDPRVFVVLTRAEADALTMVATRSPAQRTEALRAVAKIRTALEQTQAVDAVDPHALAREIHPSA